VDKLWIHPLIEEENHFLGRRKEKMSQGANWKSA